MNKSQAIATFLLALTATAGYADGGKTGGGITFAVDENLAPVTPPHHLYTGEGIANFILTEEQVPKEAQHIIATSFSDGNDFSPMGKDAFFRTIVDAYANHRSITLSPDMVWLVISQGFARYVNAHAEALRPQLVSHEGEMDLAVMTDQDLSTDQVDWMSLTDGFASQIGKYTKDGIAKTLVSDFSTTGLIERVASQVTLMESVKPYFEYIVFRIACGIPTITLQGTVEDWQRVLGKTRQLKQYGLGSWVSALEPILEEFVQAASGHPHQAFWKGMVKKHNVASLKGGVCSPLGERTELDGWLLKFFPDENGQTQDKVRHTKQMPPEYVRVGFKYRVIDPGNGLLISETPMELWAGFIGAKVDTMSNMLTPVVGWLVREVESDDDTLNEFKKNNDYGIHLRVKEVPEILSRLDHITDLHLVFTDKVVLPEWMDRMVIDHLTIEGEMAETEKAAIRQRFPHIEIR